MPNDEKWQEMYQEYLKLSANALKEELKQRNLPQKGRKPDLATRLTNYDCQSSNHPHSNSNSNSNPTNQDESSSLLSPKETEKEHDEPLFSPSTTKKLYSYCGIPLSSAASYALGKANFNTPTPIQEAVLPLLMNPNLAKKNNKGKSRSPLILHAETGSGKTLAYLLPITEALWLDDDNEDDDDDWFAFVLTPTRELAAQVAGVAMVLAPPGSVRMVSHPTNLMSDGLKDRGEQIFGGRLEDTDNNDNGMRQQPPKRGKRISKPRFFIGSAKSIMHSLYGDGKKMPASPTTKPEAMHILQHTKWIVLDEVDRLLHVQSSKNKIAKQSSIKHEKPAAVVTSAIARWTLGRAQVVAASATVGRTLKRELARVLGLSSQQAPLVVVPSNTKNYNSNDRKARIMQDDDDDIDDDEDNTDMEATNQNRHIGRAVTIPDTVEHYMVSVDTMSVGKILTSAIYVLKTLNKYHNNNKNKHEELKILLVLTKNCGIATQNAIGALKQFHCQPEPISLMNALLPVNAAANGIGVGNGDGNGTDQMIEIHRQVSGATGIGEALSASSFSSSSYFDTTTTANDNNIGSGKGYLLVTGEDSIRGLHLDGLNVVVVVGRAPGPDEYTHIAGRTGRAGKKGKVINVLGDQHARAVLRWETMLSIDFNRIAVEDIEHLKFE